MSLPATASQCRTVEISAGRRREPREEQQTTADRGFMEVFVARQPIFDRELNVYGYELLFRSRPDSSCAEASDSMASLQVITNTFLSIGMDRLLGDARGFINFPQELLAGEWAYSLPLSRTVIEILETVKPEPAVIAACRALREKGYILALDDFADAECWDEMADLASIIKVDFRDTTPAAQRLLVERYAPRGISMLAEKIETPEEYRRAREMGYQYFQGYFFARPVLVSRREIPGCKLSYLRILGEIHRNELEFRELEALIQREVSLASKLLRYINSAMFGWVNPVQSIRQALALLGEREIRNWVSLAALPMLAVDKPAELMRTALLRARFSELLAQWVGLGHRKSDLFLIGLFSLLDAMLDRPLEETLAEMGLSGDIADTLLGTSPPGRPLAGVYALVRQYEAGDWEALAATASRLHVPTDIIPTLYLNAVTWSDRIFQEGTGA
jgi:c-di-GMP-related signal transduction protein